MPIFISKDFETSLLTLLGVSLVLWRRKADNEHSNPLFYGPSPLNSQHLDFQFPIASLLKFFVRSRRNWEKKCREGSRQLYPTLIKKKIKFSSCLRTFRRDRLLYEENFVFFFISVLYSVHLAPNLP